MKSDLNKLLVILIAAILSVAHLQAEPKPTGPGKPPENGAPKKEFAEKRKGHFQEMKAELGLTEDQSQKLEALMKENFEAMKVIKEDQSLSKEDRKAKLMAMRDAMDQKINALLTPEQVTKREELKKKRMEERKDKK
jgi:Spy/CpxP family protein refolding chaperone